MSYLDPSRPISERVQDLLGQLTLDEKIGQMCNEAKAIPRLNIPAYNFWNEALHGVARNGCATVFPQAIGMAATWDPALIERVATAISDEGRAKYHAALKRKGYTDIYQGLTFWSPNVNIFRDPRWGRGQETWGEDPYLTGEMGAAFVRGLQGDDPDHLKTAACAKHYAVHSGPEKDRHHFDVQVSKQEMYTTYLPAFKKLVTEAHVEAVMGAYNRVNGEPACGSKTLLVDILRDEWGFEGHVVSDCAALNDFHLHHKVTADAAETSAMALLAGCDMSCICTYEHLGEAVRRGLITEADIDRSLTRTLTTRFKLGMFDPPGADPYANIPLSVVNSAEHRQLAYETALKSVVLLKNKNQILPIRDDIRRILVVGPNAASMDVLLGNYFGLSNTLSTLVEGIVGRVPEGVRTEYHPGCHLFQPRQNTSDWTVSAAGAADLTIACMGLSPVLEGEEGDVILSKEVGDRSDIGLPASQVEYLKKLAMSGAKVVLVLTGGSPVTLGEIEDLVEAVVYIWYPGQEGGRAVADILFGDVNPSGKLPLTFPQSMDQLPPFDDYRMAGRTYRYGTFEPLYPFGFGLSYTRFEYQNLMLNQTELTPGQPLSGCVTLTNAGSVAGEEVVQFYLSDLEASVSVPLHSLIGFQRVALDPGERREIQFTIESEKMMLVNEQGQLQLEAGEFRLTVGGRSPMPVRSKLSAPELLSAVFQVKHANR
jgi:beta-glucosidase